jgi:hypothetical protein
VRIYDRCKNPVDALFLLELLEGWNHREHVWRFKKLEVCAVCHNHFRIRTRRCYFDDWIFSRRYKEWISN